MAATALVYVGHADDAVITWGGVFLQLLTCFCTPWIIIVTIGRFRRRGYYDVEDLQAFDRGRRGGAYRFWHGPDLRGPGVRTAAVATGLARFPEPAEVYGPEREVRAAEPIGSGEPSR